MNQIEQAIKDRYTTNIMTLLSMLLIRWENLILRISYPTFLHIFYSVFMLKFSHIPLE